MLTTTEATDARTVVPWVVRARTVNEYFLLFTRFSTVHERAGAVEPLLFVEQVRVGRPGDVAVTV